MKRSFEILQQVEKKLQEGLLQTLARTSIIPVDGKAPGLDLELLTSEEVTKLVQRVFLVPNLGGGLRTVLFSGVNHGDGCSWTCARAGETLAAQGAGSVCVVDANLRAPSLHKYFGVDNLPGLGDAVLQPGPVRNFVHQLAARNLFLVPCGTPTSDPHALLASDRLRSRITELRSEFDYVLVDAPPVVLYADAVILGQLADGVILVVGANAARRETARKAKESLDAANVRLLGAVLNRRTFPVPEALYRKL